MKIVLKIRDLTLGTFSRVSAGRSQEALAECITGLYIM